jgi:hypothetical protein
MLVKSVTYAERAKQAEPDRQKEMNPARQQQHQRELQRYESTSRNPPRPTRAADGAHRNGRNLLPQPAGEGGRIETDRAADPETRYSIFGGEFVNLAFGDIQQFGNIGDGEGVRPPVERVREIHSQVLHISAPERAVWKEMICSGFGACPPKSGATA